MTRRFLLSLFTAAAFLARPVRAAIPRLRPDVVPFGPTRDKSVTSICVQIENRAPVIVNAEVAGGCSRRYWIWPGDRRRRRFLCLPFPPVSTAVSLRFETAEAGTAFKLYRVDVDAGVLDSRLRELAG